MSSLRIKTNKSKQHRDNRTTIDVIHVNVVNKINKESSKKIKIKWLSNKILKEKFYSYKQIKKWQPINSKIQDIVNLIKK